QQHQHAHVEQVRPQHHLPAPQELAGLRTPAVLAGVETQDAAHHQHGHGQVGIPAECELIDEVAHGLGSLLDVRRTTLIGTATPAAAPMPPVAATLNVTGASSHSSSTRAGSSSGSRACSSRSASASYLPSASATSAWKMPA